MERVFLGWDEPFLPRAARWVIEHFLEDPSLDLSGQVVVLPGARAGRRWLELLVEGCEERGLALDPPRIVTAGVLPELLMPASESTASELARQLAWAQALRELDPEGLARILVAPPPAEATLDWIDLARSLEQLHRELAGEDLDFADVPRRGLAALGDLSAEIERWEAMALVQEGYRRLLRTAGLTDPQDRRRRASRLETIEAPASLLLVGVVEANGLLRGLLERSRPEPVALIHAPPEQSEGFDALGFVRPSAWLEQELPIAEETLRVAEDPSGQALELLRFLEELGDRHRAEEISVGVPDAELRRPIEQALGEAGLPTHASEGEPAGRTPAHRLLAALARLQAGGGFEDLAALARHPVLQDWLESERPALAGVELGHRLDHYHERHLPHRGRGPWPGEESTTRSIRELEMGVHALLAPLDGPRRPAADWAEALLDLFLRLFGGRELDRHVEADRRLMEFGDRWLEACRELRALEWSWAPSLRGHEALEFLLRHVAEHPLTPPAREHAVELLGWLELALDDAPVLAITGLNDGAVPGATLGDPFLPDTLRSALGLVDNQRRQGRDHYLLRAALAGRKSLCLLSGRRGPGGDPLRPSRLLFACDRERAARRVLRFLEPSPEGATLRLLEAGAARSAFLVPCPIPPERPPDVLAVTAFSAYLACPYRFYLRHVLGLRGEEDELREMDGAAFGSLAHAVLQRFGEGELRHADDPERIARFLDAALDEELQARFGDEPMAAVRIQGEQLRRRLHSFATAQAQTVREGWRIEAVELELDEEQGILEVDGQPVRMHGRIDRVDRHRDGRRRVLDYKSGERARDPERSHHDGQRWVDLQLPLYGHLLAEPGETLELGYATLSRETDDEVFRLAGWSAEQRAEAVETARAVIRDLRAGRYWPPGDPPPYRDPYTAICQDEQFREMLTGEEEGA